MLLGMACAGGPNHAPKAFVPSSLADDFSDIKELCIFVLGLDGWVEMQNS